MNTIRTHNLIGIDHLGHTCSCGDRSTHWEDHLYLLTLETLGENPDHIQKTRDALAAERAALAAAAERRRHLEETAEQRRLDYNRRYAATRPSRAKRRVLSRWAA